MAAPRFNLGRQSSLAPERHGDRGLDAGDHELDEIGSDDIRIMYLAHDGDVAGIRELLDSGVKVNYRDADGRTALHVATCEGSAEVVELLLERGAQVDAEDRWGSTPLADALHYKNQDVVQLLEKYGAKVKVAPMHVNNARQVPEYEIHPSELDFTNSVVIAEDTYHSATWRGTPVVVKRLDDDLIMDDDRVRAFRDELALLQLVRHPNVVQFLGAVTQSSPMMIVIEYLPKGDLRTFLKTKGALKPSLVVKYALDIARGMNYLHEHRPEAIIHRDLEPSNILRDDTGHLKVADFGLSKMLKWRKVKEDRPVTCQDSACRYLAPEVLRNEEYDMKVDIFSFALILQEMIEGCLPFADKKDCDVPKAFASKQRPPFKAPSKNYAHGLKELIEQCWNENPADRPRFREVIDTLTVIQKKVAHEKRWKCFLCFG